jgi:hypothetical protein
VSDFSNDTSPEMDARWLAMVMARPPGGERLKIAMEMAETSRKLMIASIRAARPEITEAELRQELFLRYYGDEFSAEQREAILAAIAAYWARKQAT